MPSAIVYTPGAANANSYDSLANLLAILDDRTDGSNVAGLDPDVQARCAITSCNMIETMAKWADGYPASNTQSLFWPAAGMLDKFGRYIASNVIPTDIKRAQAELMHFLSLEDRLGDAALEGFEEIALPKGIRFKASGKGRTFLPDTVKMILAPYVVGFNDPRGDFQSVRLGGWP